MYLKAFPLIILFVILFSCKNEDKVITFKDHTFSLPDNTLVDIHIPKAFGASEITEKINTALENTVSASLNTYESDNVERKTITENIDLFNKQFESFKADFPESNQVWEAQIDGEVLYQTDEIISISITTYLNTGGAHGNLNITFLNFNTNTGVLIPNNKLFNDIEAFKKEAKPYFLKSIKNKEITVNTKEAFTLPENIAYNEDGIILLYNTYEIAPYSTGIIEFKVPFEKINGLLVFDSF